MGDILLINGKEYITSGTARGYLQCSEGRLNIYIVEGRLRAEQHGRQQLIELESLQNLVAELMAKQSNQR